MKLILAIGIGSFIGGVGRYLLSILLQHRVTIEFPLGTLCVNLLGCLLIGFVYGISEKGMISPEWRLFLATGVLGGFTTFSAFSYESISLIKNGFLLNAGLYIFFSVFAGLLATFTGLYFSKVL